MEVHGKASWPEGWVTSERIQWLRQGTWPIALTKAVFRWVPTPISIDREPFNPASALPRIYPITSQTPLKTAASPCLLRPGARI